VIFKTIVSFYECLGRLARSCDTVASDWPHTGGTFAGQAVSYEFDPAGLRRKRTNGTATTRYLHGGLFEADSSGTITLMTGVRSCNRVNLTVRFGR